jgi:hypothetical protein
MRSWANSMMLGELRVAMSLARRWRDQGKVSEAREQRITVTSLRRRNPRSTSTMGAEF